MLEYQKIAQYGDITKVLAMQKVALTDKYMALQDEIKILNEQMGQAMQTIHNDQLTQADREQAQEEYQSLSDQKARAQMEQHRIREAENDIQRAIDGLHR